MKKVTKAEAFKAFTAVIDEAQNCDRYITADNVITVTRFIEQQYDYERTFDESNEKAEGTI